MSFDYPYAGLILPDAQDLAPGPYLDSAARVLRRLDPCADHRTPIHRGGNRVMGRHLGISVMAEDQGDYGPRVVLEVVTVDGTPPDETGAARLLSDTVRDALDHSSADILEWYAPEVLIDRDDFIRLRHMVSPRRVHRIEPETEDELFECAANAQVSGGLADDTSMPDCPTPAAITARRGFFDLRRIRRMTAVAGAMALFGSTGHAQNLLIQLLQ